MSENLSNVDSANKTGYAPARHSHVGFYAIIAALLIIGGGLLVYLTTDFSSNPKVALVTSTDSPYWDLVIKGAEDAAREYKADLTVVRSKADEGQQSQSVHDLLNKGIVGIGISPIDPDKQQSLLDEVAGKATLVTFDSDAPKSRRAAFIGSNNYFSGWMCGEEVEKAIPDGGEIVISVGSIARENGRERRRGLIDLLLERPFKPSSEDSDAIDASLKGKRYTISATLLDDGDAKKATAMAVDAIKSKPNLKCLVGLYAYSTPALLEALKQTDKVGKIQVVGFDAADELQGGIDDGSVYSSILQDQYIFGYETVRILCDAARNHPEAGWKQVRYMAPTILNKDTMTALREAKRIRQPAMASAAPAK